MIEFSAVYYDGRTSARAAVTVRGLPHSLHITGAELNFEVPLDAIVVDAPVGGIRRTLVLPGGGQLQTDDHAALAALFPRANRLETWVQTLERRWGYALAGVALTAVFAWWCVVFGLPLAATSIAKRIPHAVEETLGGQTLATLDKSLCNPSTVVGEKMTADLRKTFSRLTAGLDDGYAYRLELRHCGALGANAFALPGGTVVITDDLVKIAQNDSQIAAVLAHEIGHVRHRHGMRLAVQAAGLAALVAVLAGDAVTMTKLAVALPTLLLQNGYSRALETEADTYAFERMKAIGLSPAHFAEIMELMEKRRAAGKKDAGDADPDDSAGYLSTHPATAERIQRARDYR